ncbi:MAG: DUF402 domain-containing protein [Terracoccus sp.]
MPRRADPSLPDTASPHRGDEVLGRFTKWGGGAHWEWVGRYLEEDEFGRWLTAPAGTRCSRPGVSFLEPDPWVSLVPRDAGWVAGFYPATKGIGLYVDMTTVPCWVPLAPGPGGPRWEVTMVDLDLDVILTREGHLFVDDEDEFEQHQGLLRYPPEVISLAEQTAREVLDAVGAGREPFATVGFERLRQVTSAG